MIMMMMMMMMMMMIIIIIIIIIMVAIMTSKVHNFATTPHNLIYYRCKIHYKGPILMVNFKEKALLLGYFCLLEDYTLLELFSI